MARHIMVKAGAGTGKTFTYKRGLQLAISPNLDDGIVGTDSQEAIWDSMAEEKIGTCTVVAFNKAIATEAQREIPDKYQASTFHSMCFGAVRSRFPKVKVNKFKMNDLIDAKTRLRVKTSDRDASIASAAMRLVDLCKATLTGAWIDDEFVVTEDQLMALIQHYGVDVNGSLADVLELVPQLFTLGMQDETCIDFSDMVYWVIGKDLSLPQSDLLIVDESQDLNACQHDIVFRAGRRIMVVGDENQAIYGFSGADCNSMWNLEHKLAHDERGVDILPLYETRRCPKSVVELAQKIVPEYQYLPEAPQGQIDRDVSVDAFMTGVRPGDMAISRVNAPLLGTCFSLIRKGVKAQVAGRDIGQALITFITKKLQDRRRSEWSIPDMLSKLEDYRNKELERLSQSKHPDEMRVNALEDKCECVKALCDGAEDVQEVKDRVKTVFADTDLQGKPKHSVLLSSCHKAKGLEADSVWVMNPDLMPHPTAKIAWQKKQEKNLQYVAWTRTKSRLAFLETK